VFQVHGVDAEGQVVMQRRLTRAKLVPFFEKPPLCRVGMEACATAHPWGGRLNARCAARICSWPRLQSRARVAVA